MRMKAQQDGQISFRRSVCPDRFGGVGAAGT
jgi:hypothetical protein